MLFDFHTHTSFSADCEAHPEDMIKQAIKLGFKKYCITDHQDFEYPIDEIKFDVDPKEYFKTLMPLKEKYTDQIQVYLGIEVGLEKQHWQKLDNYINSNPFDFVIASMHLLNGKDPYYPEFFEGAKDLDIFMEFFNSTYENIKGFKNFNVLGHLDYVVRYAPEKNKNFSYPLFADIIDLILKELIETGRGIELNSSGYRRGLNNPHPSKEILKRYKELGGEIITIGSDAHCIEDIGRDFVQAKAVLHEYAYKYITVFKERKPEFIKIKY